MAVERMVCCGALTAVYRDQGDRRHNPGCEYYKERSSERDSKDNCAKCGALIGRAGRTNEELFEAHMNGGLLTAFGAIDYSSNPVVTTYYCGPCFNETIQKKT